jgi:hypothetical protein
VFRCGDCAGFLNGEMTEERLGESAEALAASPSVLMSCTYQPVGMMSSDESRPLQLRRLAAPKATKVVGLYALSTPQIVVTASSMMASISARGMRARARIESVWRVADATRASRRG